MDLDYMDELLLESNASEFSQFDPSTSISPFEPSFVWPALETNEGPSNDSQQVDRQRSSFSKNLSISQSQSSIVPRPENSFVEAQRWWIGPWPSNSVLDRLNQALEHIKERSRDKDMLIQVWIPVSKDGKCVLTTHNQPFSLDLNCQQRLAHYRDISVNYQFVADKDSKEVVGLPGWVFMNKVPEWTPDVRFFTWDEYRRVGHAQKFDVRGTLAVPVLEQGSGSCLCVIEVVLTKQKIQFRTEIESVCEALEAVNLKSANVSSKIQRQGLCLIYNGIAVCPTTLKRICRQHGIQRWPSRKIKKVGHSLQKIQRVIDSVHGASGLLQLESFYTNFPDLASSQTTTRPPEPKSPARSPRPTDTSSCSQNSSSSQCYSSEAQPVANSVSLSGHEGQTVKDEPGQGPVNGIETRQNLQPSVDGPRETGGQRVKVNYGEDTIRLRMQSGWGYVDLLREITRRFGVGSGVEFHLKYLDDDAEWVLLTCDDDLAECVDLCRSSGAHMIRLVLVRR